VLARAHSHAPAAAFRTALVRPEIDAGRPVAVILNEHARGVSPRMVRQLGRLLPPRDLYLSRSLAESNAIAGEVVDRGYRAVLLGGGDGTVVQCLTDLRAHARRRGRTLPSVGVLPLGTGNALAWALDSTSTSEDALRASIAHACDPLRREPLQLLDVDGRLTPFAGVGLDANIQEDFTATTRLLDRVGVGRRLGAGARYALSVALRSAPRYVASELPEVVAVNRGAPAVRVGLGGRVLGASIPAGEVLYRGRCSIATGSSIPYFGLGMKMFPYAQRERGRFQLRCASISAARILGHLPAIWRGEFADDAVADFLVDDVELHLERPVAFQIGGDLQPGLRDRVRLTLARPIRVVH
jgi:diacylglycerol kinase family enzyme